MSSRKAPSGKDLLAMAVANGYEWRVTAGAEDAPPGLSKEEKAIRRAVALDAARGTKVTINGITYDSGDEAKRHAALLRWQAAGVISSLKAKPNVRILDGFDHPDFGHVIARNWKLDFMYRQRQAPGLLILEDFKGYPSDAWEQALPFRLWFLRQRRPKWHVFVNRAISGWYEPPQGK